MAEDDGGGSVVAWLLGAVAVMGLGLPCARAQTLDPASAQTTAQTAAPAPWQASVWLDEQSLADGLPVLALGRASWYQGLGAPVACPRAQRQLQAGVEARHASGWRVGTLVRSYAQLQASPDAVAVAATAAQKQDLPAGAWADVAVRSEGWSGAGLQLGTPWRPLPAAWPLRWRADAQWLRLMKLRHNQLQGQLMHTGGSTYDMGLTADRWGEQIVGPFLPSSSASGWGASLSLALDMQPATGWQVGLRADDLLSRLHWMALAREASVIDSEVSSRTPDGSVDYAAVVNGQQTVGRWSGRMAVRWQLDVRRSLASDHGALTWRHMQWDGLHQHWLEWASPPAPVWAWRVAVEPVRQVLSGTLQWQGLSVSLATDGQGSAQSQYRCVVLRWQVPL